MPKIDVLAVSLGLNLGSDDLFADFLQQGFDWLLQGFDYDLKDHLLFEQEIDFVHEALDSVVKLPDGIEKFWLSKILIRIYWVLYKFLTKKLRKKHLVYSEEGDPFL